MFQSNCVIVWDDETRDGVVFDTGGDPHRIIDYIEQNKINVHAPELWQNGAFTLRGQTAQPGCGDFCFVWSGGLTDLKEKLHQAGAVIEEGPVERIGGRNAGHAKGVSIYTRDPDNNLLEFIVYGSAG